MNIGAFHEALNFAAIWKLPVVFVCENNLWMEYTRTSEVTAVANPAADRASAYGLESIIVDGNDADAVYEVAAAAIDRARQGDGPSLIEAKTYRHGGHSTGRPGQVSTRRRGRGVAREGPDPALSRTTARVGRRPRTQLVEIEAIGRGGRGAGDRRGESRRCPG